MKTDHLLRCTPCLASMPTSDAILTPDASSTPPAPPSSRNARAALPDHLERACANLRATGLWP